MDRITILNDEILEQHFKRAKRYFIHHRHESVFWLKTHYMIDYKEYFESEEKTQFIEYLREALLPDTKIYEDRHDNYMSREIEPEYLEKCFCVLYHSLKKIIMYGYAAVSNMDCDDYCLWHKHYYDEILEIVPDILMTMDILVDCMEGDPDERAPERTIEEMARVSKLFLELISAISTSEASKVIFG